MPVFMKVHARYLFIATTAMFLLPTVSEAAGVQNVTVVALSIYTGSGLPGALIKFSPAAPNLEGCSYNVGDYAFINFAAQVVPSGKDVYASVVYGRSHY